MRTKIQWRPKMIFHMQITYSRLWLLNVGPLWFTWQWDMWLGAVAVLNTDIGPFYSEDWFSAGTTEFFVFRRENSLNTKLHEHHQSKVCRVNKENAGVVELSLCSTWWHVWNSLFCAEKQRVPGPGRGQCLSVHLASERKRFSSLNLYL